MLNHNGGPRPLSKKKTVQLMVILTILAWATQTLFHQWGYGQTTQPAEASTSDEKFVPGTARFASGATIELRNEATVVGAEVKLKQVCRWSDSDAAVFAPIADLTLMRLGPRVPFRSINLSDIKSTLHDAGVNIAAINFVGAVACTVGRSDVEFNEGEALKKWIDAREGKIGPTTEVADAGDAPATALAPATQPAAVASAARKPVAVEEANQYHTLRELLIEDIATRLNLPAEKLQMSFRQQDERLLSLSEPNFKFQIDPARARDLGDVSWNVTVFAADSRQAANVAATARAWQTQLVVSKPMSFKQVITESDVIERRALIDRIGDDTVIDKSQAIGQQAGRDLKPGTVLTAKMVDAIQLVRAGQFVTVVYRQGGIELKSVARAMEGGSFGQSIRVKNESTKDIFQVVLTGPQIASMTSPTLPTSVVAARE